ncbi:MAG: hypothetical protein NC548_12745 [Lachnospiraceae bacterium]|nr:hypothetical protein [Lachnospiraceae bacterium]MCM1230742.1 hypothetical protein [Ruminococcus flavefaciens]
MSEISAAQKEANWVDRYTNGIRKGIWTFADVGARDWKEQIKDILMKEIESGEANDTTVNAVADYFADQIKRKRITIDDVPDIMKSKVEERAS